MVTKSKEVQSATLESRFKKLHDVAHFAEENGKAICFHVEDLEQFALSEEESTTVENLKSDLDNWCGLFVRLAGQMQEVESKYWDTLSEDKSKCILIEKVPSYTKNQIPSFFKMTEKLFDIGYYTMDDDDMDDDADTNVVFSKEAILSNIKELHMNMTLCLKALANANYQGIWKPIEKMVFEVYDSEPAYSIDRLLQVYNAAE